jgi:putative nucleotidyltransferase-like protein
MRVDQQLTALAAHGLAGSVLEVAPAPASPHRWFELLRRCRAHGLVSLLAAAAQRSDVTPSPAQAEELAGVERELAALSLLAEQRAMQASAVLDGIGLGHRVLGGSPRSRLAYRDPSIRTFPSVSLLVAPDALPVARSLCHDVQGYRVVVCAELGQGATRLVLAQMDDPGALLVLGDRPVPTATVEEHLVLACLDLIAFANTADLGSPAAGDRLMVQRDVAELVLSPAVDPDQVRQVAQRWNVVEPTARAIARTWADFALADRTALSVWAERELHPRSRRARPWGRSVR